MGCKNKDSFLNCKINLTLNLKAVKLNLKNCLSELRRMFFACILNFVLCKFVVKKSYMTSKEIITAFLSVYKEEARFLYSFHLEKLVGKGSFKINSNFYCTKDQPIHYFSATEMQLCINQLLYVYFTSLGLIPFHNDYLNSTRFIESFDERYYIIEQTCKFKEKISVSELIQAEIMISKKKLLGANLYIECIFNFEQKCFGSVKCLLKTVSNG